MNKKLNTINNIIINKRVSIAPGELEFRFARSGGKGGQNVNKVETKVELRFNIKNSTAFTEEERNQLLKNLSTKLDSSGNINVIAQSSRSQWSNRETAVKKFVDLLQKALKPVKRRIPTKVGKASKEHRLKNKKRRGEIKRLRRVEY